jgi:hypothetical protein
MNKQPPYLRARRVEEREGGMKRVARLMYRILAAVVVVMMALESLNQAWYNVFLCVLTLALFSIPAFVERRIKIEVPDALEIVVLLFVFAAEILGEMKDFYRSFPYWDTILHTINGFMCAAIGLALINILNNSPRFALSLSPLFVVVVAFCFANTIGILWEFFEYGMDTVFGIDMQKDSILANGAVDIGLIDTMEDLLVNFVGSVVFSVFGFFYVKHKGKGRVVNGVLLTKMEPDDSAGDDNENFSEIS